MDTNDRQAILEQLQQGREELQSALAGLTAEQASRAPDGRWSPAQIVEHLAITEEILLQLGQRATPGPSTPNPDREAKIVAKGLDRTRLLTVPDGAQPPGHALDLAAALHRIDTARAATLAWVDGFQDNPRAFFTTHPMVRGPVNCYEMMLLIAIHARRHAAQIRELHQNA